MGMSLRQTADLFRALGATDAVNLDGGGSSAMAVRGPTATSSSDARAHLVNHPSDSVGERPVANALALLRSCR
jgi:exopolysaccharide biosynthesis protein